MKLAILLYVLAVAGCSTANDWRPHHPQPEAPRVPICVQYGSKLYDRVTGEECPDLHRHVRRAAK